jgi:hypothetical protein
MIPTQMPDQGFAGMPPGESLPPELAAILAASQQTQPQQQEQPVDPTEHLRIAIEHLQQAQVAEPSDADSQALATCASKLYQILASRQKELDTALGNPTLMSLSRR